MYVCKKCHDIDVDATQCIGTWDDHISFDGCDDQWCDICGKWKACVYCSAYVSNALGKMAP